MNPIISIVNMYFSSLRRKVRRGIKRRCSIRGERFLLDRPSLPPVEAYRYLPTTEAKKPMPLVINVHGGAWVRGDALVLDTESGMIADSLGATVLNLNYKKLDRHPFPYAQEELFSLAKHYIDNADRYGIDKNRVVLMGYSAGAHLCAVAVQMLRDVGISVYYQVLCYPFTDFTYGGGTQKEIKDELDKVKLMDKVFFSEISRENPLASPGINPNLSGLPSTIITTCGNDPLRVQGEAYAKRLADEGIKVALICDVEAIHGYMECNYPETAEDPSKNPTQEALCRNTLGRILQQLKDDSIG